MEGEAAFSASLEPGDPSVPPEYITTRAEPSKDLSSRAVAEGAEAQEEIKTHAAARQVPRINRWFMSYTPSLLLLKDMLS